MAASASADRNVLLNENELHPPSAQAIGAAHFPGPVLDAMPIPRTAVAALPIRDTAEMRLRDVRSNGGGTVGNNIHKVFISYRAVRVTWI